MPVPVEEPVLVPVEEPVQKPVPVPVPVPVEEPVPVPVPEVVFVLDDGCQVKVMTEVDDPPWV